MNFNLSFKNLHFISYVLHNIVTYIVQLKMNSAQIKDEQVESREEVLTQWSRVHTKPERN